MMLPYTLVHYDMRQCHYYSRGHLRRCVAIGWHSWLANGGLTSSVLRLL